MVKQLTISQLYQRVPTLTPLTSRDRGPFASIMVGEGQWAAFKGITVDETIFFQNATGDRKIQVLKNPDGLGRDLSLMAGDAGTGVNTGGNLRLVPGTSIGGAAAASILVRNAADDTTIRNLSTTTAPVSVGAANAIGSSINFALADHVHDHAAQTADNHTIYLLAGGTRALTANWVTGNFSIRHGDGTIGAPIMTFDADPDTGFYRPAANTIGVVGGGTLWAQFEAPGLDDFSAMLLRVRQAGVETTRRVELAAAGGGYQILRVAG